MGCSPWGCKELDTTEVTEHSIHIPDERECVLCIDMSECLLSVYNFTYLMIGIIFHILFSRFVYFRPLPSYSQYWTLKHILIVQHDLFHVMIQTG